MWNESRAARLRGRCIHLFRWVARRRAQHPAAHAVGAHFFNGRACLWRALVDPLARAVAAEEMGPIVILGRGASGSTLIRRVDYYCSARGPRGALVGVRGVLA